MLKIIKVALLCSSILVAMVLGGCGSDTNGTLKVTPSRVDTSTSSDVSFKVEYIHPSRTDLQGLQIKYLVTYGESVRDQGTMVTNNAGAFVLTYPAVERTDVDVPMRLEASIGELEASNSTTVPKLAPVTTTP